MGESVLPEKTKAPGWVMRHGATLLVSGVLFALFYYVAHDTWSPMHRWNRALGDSGTVLIIFAVMAGPLARLWPRAQNLLPWRREAGIYGVIYAAAHTIIIIAGWVEWDLMRLIGFEIHPQTGQYVMLQKGFAIANIIGIVALVYGAILAVTSSNRAQVWLGQSAWKFVQRGAYVLWAFVVLHTAYFLYIHFLDFHRQVPEPNILQWPFALVVAGVLMLQIAAFITTLKMRMRKRV